MSILFVAALLFVVGVVMIAFAKNVPPLGVLDRVAWILWAIAAVLWFYSRGGG